ncbi:hypothetical protein [Micromonospora maritima]|uniref:hypothetical protein n=1 Tax=Micromonospora maritima TaxID=986711 RepID=UPI00157C3CBB|nr:hypothetical protein [Micromonospora maritima]
MESVDPGGPLTDAEVRELVRLLARFASHDLDQWENWRVDTPHGPVFMTVSRKVPPDWPEDAFVPIWPPPAPPSADRHEGWTVWRQDDNGNRYEVSRHASRAEADSTAARMEARGHKQTYWVARSG